LSILAGCDFVFEISHAALLKQLRSVPLVGGQTLQTPFELTVPGKLGAAHVMVDEVLVDLNQDNTVTITFVFARSSLTSKDKPPKSLYPLSGRLTVNLRVVLFPTIPSPPVSTVQTLALDFAQCPVSLTLSTASQQLIALVATTAQKSPAQLTAEFEGTIRDYFQSRPQAVLPGGTAVTPDTDGSLQPLALRSLRLQCFGPADQNLQGVGLFGNFFGDTKFAGNPANRTQSAVPAGQETLVTLSLRSFRTFLFCPSLRTNVAGLLKRPQLTLDELPGICGRGSSIDLNDVTVTNIDAFFGQGRLQLNVSFEKSDTCYDASGTMVTYVLLAVSGGAIIATAQPQTPNIKIDVSFWCELLPLAVLGPVGDLFTTWMEDILVDVAANAAVSIVSTMTGSSLPAPSTPGVQLTGVTITPNELSLGGRIPSYQPPAPTPELFLELVRKSEFVSESKPHVWTTQLWCQNEVKNYWYTETIQTQTQRYRLNAKLIALPLSVAYSVRGGAGPWQKLDQQPGTSGNVAGGFSQPFIVIRDLECRYPTPLSSGGSVVVRDVSLLYSLLGNEVALTSLTGEGNFAMDLRAEVLDANGQPPPGVDAAPFLSVFFNSDIVEMGIDYVDDLKECADLVKATSEKFGKSQRVPRWKQVFSRAEREVLDDMELLTGLEVVRGEDMARHFRNAHGGMLGRIPAAKQAAVANTNAGTDTELIATQLEANIGALQRSLLKSRSQLD